MLKLLNGIKIMYSYYLFTLKLMVNVEQPEMFIGGHNDEGE